MSELADLLSLQPSNLAQRQARAYAAHLEATLMEALKVVRSYRHKADGGKFPQLSVTDLTFHSPGGDDAGSDDTPIDFRVDGMENSPAAFGEAIAHLNGLSRLAAAGEA